MDNKTAVITGATAPVKAIWLYPDGVPQPYMHNIEGDCACKTCESKIRRIIVPFAA